MIAGWEIRTVIIGVGLFTLIYRLIGGIEASIWTSVLQGGVMIGGAVGIMASIILESGLPAPTIFSHAYADGKFDIGNTEFSTRSLYFAQPTAWIYFVAGLSSVIRIYITQQGIVHRYLVARSDADSKQDVKLGILSTVPIWFAFGIIGCAL